MQQINNPNVGQNRGHPMQPPQPPFDDRNPMPGNFQYLLLVKYLWI